jgi:hypothetical protein
VTIGGDGGAPRTRSRLGWLRAASDRVPTRWFAGIATGIFLAGTAAFGGLATAAEPAVTALDPGDEHRNDQIAVTIERAVLVDEFPEAGIFVEDGERVLAVLLSVENTWIEPLPAYPGSSVTESLVIDGLPAEPDSVARYDDATLSPVLQPGVPAQVVFAWAVKSGAFDDDERLTVTLNDMTLYTGSFVANGQWWTDPVEAATVSVALEDIGAGA